MSNDTQAKDTEEQGRMQAPPMPINILAQYVRDLSFENPNAPESLRGGAGGPPEMDINIGMDARKIPDDQIENLYEVVLNLRAVALQNKEPLFIAELQYGITATIQGVPEDNHHPILFIEIPRLAFPFARQIMSDMTIQGGFPPLMLNPVDFHALYLDRFKEEIAQSKEQMRQELESALEKTKH